MVCFKCGEQNPYGTKICNNCNARMISVPPDSKSQFNIKELGTKGDPFKSQAREFDYSFPYMTGHFSGLTETIGEILEGKGSLTDLNKIISKIEEGAEDYLYEVLPEVRKKIEAPAVSDYRHILEKSANLTELGFMNFLDGAEEINLVFQDGHNYHLEKGLEICFRANNLISLGYVLAEKFRTRKELAGVEKEIEEYLDKENISLT